MTSNNKSLPPTVRLVGQFSHVDFRDAAALLRAEAHLEINADGAPELIVAAQNRPGEFPQREIESLQRRWPLAGIVALSGSWCEGETRTGRPWPRVQRLYWYDFPAWWRRQLALRAAGCCPDWARLLDTGIPKTASRKDGHGIVVLGTANRDTAYALADVLKPVGYSTVWQPLHRPALVLSGVAAGIWDGGQLNAAEAKDLAAFCLKMARYVAPVAAMLDFPRRDRLEHAISLGAAAVLGKPFLNADLAAMIENIAKREPAGGSRIGRAA